MDKNQTLRARDDGRIQSAVNRSEKTCFPSTCHCLVRSWRFRAKYGESRCKQALGISPKALFPQSKPSNRAHHIGRNTISRTTSSAVSVSRLYSNLMECFSCPRNKTCKRSLVRLSLAEIRITSGSSSKNGWSASFLADHRSCSGARQ